MLGMIDGDRSAQTERRGQDAIVVRQRSVVVLFSREGGRSYEVSSGGGETQVGLSYTEHVQCCLSGFAHAHGTRQTLQLGDHCEITLKTIYVNICKLDTRSIRIKPDTTIVLTKQYYKKTEFDRWRCLQSLIKTVTTIPNPKNALSTILRHKFGSASGQSSFRVRAQLMQHARVHTTTREQEITNLGRPTRRRRAPIFPG